MPRAPPRSAGRLLCGLVFSRLALLLRHRILQRNLQLLDRRMRENHAVIPQQVIGMHLVAAHQLEPLNIAGTQGQIAVLVFRFFHDQHRRIHFQRVERLAEFLGLRFLQVERIHHNDLALGKLGGQRRAQRAQQFLARESVVVGSRRRTMHRRAVPPQGRTDRADAGAAGALLLPQLLAGTGNLPARLGGMRPGALPGAVMLHRFPEQVFIDRAKDFVSEIERPDLLTAQIVNINRCHSFSLLVWSGHSCPLLLAGKSARPTRTYAFFAALFAAFNGSTVAAPANPRRSRGGFFALVITMYPPCGPGTLPSTTSRFSSLSTPSTRRLRIVTC